VNLTKKLLLDLKAGYDLGLTGGYFENSAYQKYKGLLILAGIKVDLSCR
jgi:hypothetical protein